MLGLGLLVRLGRQVLAGPVADSGVLPAGYYRHLVLAALEEEDFPGALRHLKWAGDPLLAQIIVLRLRLLSARHRRQLAAIQDLWPRSRGRRAGSTTRPCWPKRPGPWNSSGITRPGRWRTWPAGDRPPPTSDPEKSRDRPGTTTIIQAIPPGMEPAGPRVARSFLWLSALPF